MLSPRWPMLAFALLLSSCLKLSSPIPATLGDDKTIVFPPFFDSPAQAVGAEGSINELDGELLRAVMVAANDLLPPSDSPRACPNRQEAHLFRVIRKEGIIFVYVYQNPAYCGPEALMLDSGAKYAISTDGRILRRVLDGQPEESPRMETFEDGGLGVPSRPGVTPAYDAVWNKPGDGGSADAGS